MTNEGAFFYAIIAMLFVIAFAVYRGIAMLGDILNDILTELRRRK